MTAILPKPDPLGLRRCESCGNAFETDRQADGSCGHCGGSFEIQFLIGTADGLRPAYAVRADDDSEPPRLFERTDDGRGAINATDDAARRSLTGGPYAVLRPDGRVLARFVGGAREGRTRPLFAPIQPESAIDKTARHM